MAGMKTLVGGEIKGYTEMLIEARQLATKRMVDEATTGLFPEETHYEVDGSTLIEVIFRHTGGNKFEPVYGDNWNIENISEMKSSGGSRTFTFDQGARYHCAEIGKIGICGGLKSEECEISGSKCDPSNCRI